MMLRSIAIFVVCARFASIAAAQEATGDGLTALVKERVIPASRADVWRAWSTSEGMSEFLVPAHIELRFGGAYELHFLPDGEAGWRGSEGCRVLSFIPERMISFTWNAPPNFRAERAEKTFVVVELEEVTPDSTRVRLTHAGWPSAKGEWPKVHAYFDAAWGGVLGHMERHFQSSPGQPEEPAAVRTAESGPKRHFAYLIHPTRPEMLTEPTEAETRTVRSHAAYIRDMLAKGELLLAGPCVAPQAFPQASADSKPFEIPPPGIVLFRARDLDHARTILEGDPAVAAGVFKGCVVEFHPAFVAK